MTDAIQSMTETPLNTPAPAAAPEGAPASWFAALPDDIKANPGVSRYDTFDKFVAAKLQLDKHLGVPETDLLKWPKADDKEGMGKVYDRLGRPEKADAYELPAAPEGMADYPDDLKQEAKAKFHELGLTAAQASALWAFQNDVGARTQGQITQATAAQTAAQTITLKNEWGGQFDARVAMTQDYIAKTASPELVAFLTTSGLDTNPQLYQLVGDLLAKMTPSGSMPGGGSGGGNVPNIGGMTPGEAQAQIDELQGDKKFMTQLQGRNDPGHKAAVKRWSDLNAAATPRT